MNQERRSRFDPPPLPLPAGGRVGFVAALLTFIAVLVEFPGFGRSVPPDADDWVFAVWTVLYAGGLAFSWWAMRPRREMPRAYTFITIPLLMQGFAYLAFWAAIIGADVAPFDRMGNQGVQAVVVLVSFFCVAMVGPFLGLGAALFARRGSSMLITQVVGTVAFFVLYSLSD